MSRRGRIRRRVAGRPRTQQSLGGGAAELPRLARRMRAPVGTDLVRLYDISSKSAGERERQQPTPDREILMRSRLVVLLCGAAASENRHSKQAIRNSFGIRKLRPEAQHIKK